MSRKNSILLLFVLAAQLAFAQSSPRKIIDFNKSWRFFLGNDSAAVSNEYNDSRWRKLDLPHDWSIEGDFSKDHPATNTGGALPAGIGWYRKTFVLPLSVNKKNLSIEFDGIYRNSEVWINGHYLGKRPNGYISFQYDITPYVKPAPAKNVVVVRVDNSGQPGSRWYTGSGIYRDVRLICTSDICSIDKNEAVITTPGITKDKAVVSIDCRIKTIQPHYLSIKGKVLIYNHTGVKVAEQESQTVLSNMTGHLYQQITIPAPVLWSPENPYLYKVVVQLLSTRGELIDEITSSLGIRFFHFDAQKGFFFNGMPMKIKGVCMHHDLGALGAAFNKSAAQRQLRILKEMGCNAIRTAHNPPAPGFLDLCDEMGFLVMDEAFDMWQKRKNRFDYHLDFKEWFRRDLADMVRRDRNHPSVFMWSIGNEIREQFDSTGISLAKEMTSIVKALDSTRPVTSALTENFAEKNFIWQSGSLDVLGFNYKLNDYKDFPQRFPGQKFIAAETASALATRGVYDLPSDSMRIWPPDSKQPFTKGNTGMTVSAYDHAYAYWGASHERSLQAVNKFDHIAGCFVWSGFDFIGEPVPYPWPARSSYYGIIDLAGFPKDVYYMYKSEWTKKPVLHIFPHWNWTVGQEVDICAYYNNADEVELFLNERSLGIKKKTNEEMHVRWRIPFQPGILKAVSRKKGKIVLTKKINTAGAPAKIELIADRKIIKADGRDLSFVTVRILDKKGNLVPYANNLVEFSVSGEGRIAATDNGYQADLTSFQSYQRKCWKGMALAIVQSSEKQGNITLKAVSAGLAPTSLVLKTSD